MAAKARTSAKGSADTKGTAAKKKPAAKAASGTGKKTAAGSGAGKKTAAPAKSAAGKKAASGKAAPAVRKRTAVVRNPEAIRRRLEETAAAQLGPGGGLISEPQAVPAEPAVDYRNPEYYYNRELSWLLFEERVLSEARDRNLVPLFERLKFLSITQSNLDEFFMVRIASLKDQVHAGYRTPDLAGLTPEVQLARLSEQIHAFVKEQYSTFSRSLVPALARADLELIRRNEELTDSERDFLLRYFEENVYPVLTPMAMDSSRPFPLVRNKTLNIGALIATKGGLGKKKKKEELVFATVQVPSVIPRIVELPVSPEGKRRIILLEDVILLFFDRLFQKYDVICACPYRIMRNADLSIDEEEAQDLLLEIKKQLKKRQWGEVIRLEVEEGIDQRLLAILVKEFAVTDADIYPIGGPLDLTLLMKIYGMKGFEALKNPSYTPAPVPEFMGEEGIFDVIRRKDVLVHHPYMSFDPVVRFVQEAAQDPECLAIKQTLYRVSGDSPIIAALAQAAENGKQVTVLVELKARFDEEHNIEWALMLEKAGCHVIYGLLGLKVHSKITMVLRREEDGIRRYVHLGTGNYNDSTARLYTDLGLFTCDAGIGADATALFNMLSGFSEPDQWRKLLVAPLWLKKEFLKLIARERDNAKAGKKAFIRAKMNSLCDPEIIAALYEASHAGVKIELLVRGICCLKVGIPGISDTITVRSIVGNFLEHSRIFWFSSDGKDEFYMGSADWMPRNLNRRVEIVFPVEDDALKEELRHILTAEFEDNVKAHVMQPDGTYEKIDKRGKQLVNSQELFAEEAWERVPKPSNLLEERRFIPLEGEKHE